MRVRDCTPTGLLAAIVYIDLVGQDEAAAEAALLAGVSNGRAKPQTLSLTLGLRPLVLPDLQPAPSQIR